MKTFLIGQGVGGIFSSALQVLSLAIGTSSEASALIYFTLGSILTTATLALFYVTKNISYYQFHIDNSVEDTKRDIIKVQELVQVSSKILSSLVIVTASALAFVPTHPSIASLVVSEYYGQGNSWNGKNTPLKIMLCIVLTNCILITGFFYYIRGMVIQNNFIKQVA